MLSRAIGAGMIFRDQPSPQQLDRIAFGHPLLLFLLAPVVFAIHIAHVMAPVSVGVAEKEGRPTTVVARARQHFSPRRTRPARPARQRCRHESQRPLAAPECLRRSSPNNACIRCRCCFRRRRSQAASKAAQDSWFRRARLGQARPHRRNKQQTRPLPSLLAENAAPVAMPVLPATIAFAPRLPVSGSAMCIDPPFPRQ